MQHIVQTRLTRQSSDVRAYRKNGTVDEFQLHVQIGIIWEQTLDDKTKRKCEQGQPHIVAVGAYNTW